MLPIHINLLQTWTEDVWGTGRGFNMETPAGHDILQLVIVGSYFPKDTLSMLQDLTARVEDLECLENI